MLSGLVFAFLLVVMAVVILGTIILAQEALNPQSEPQTIGVISAGMVLITVGLIAATLAVLANQPTCPLKLVDSNAPPVTSESSSFILCSEASKNEMWCIPDKSDAKP